MIYNDSPTEDRVESYTLGLNKTFDYSGGSCGTIGRQGGLVVRFSQTIITKIPYRTKIEVPFSITTEGKCYTYVDVRLLFSATCETVYTYQYGIKFDQATGDVAVDYGTTYGVSNSTATFSVSWKAPASAVAGTSSLEAASQSTLNSNDIRILDIVIMSLLVIVIILLSVIIYTNIMSIRKIPLTNTSPKPLYEFYESKLSSEGNYDGVNRSISNERYAYDPHVTRSQLVTDSHLDAVKNVTSPRSNKHSGILDSDRV